jgi:hypothetical protein
VQEAYLGATHLEGACLEGAHLEGRRFSEDDGDLQRIRRWKQDFPSTLSAADLREAFLNHATQLENATFGTTDLGCVRVADIRWGEVNLALVDWSNSPILGDERAARAWKLPSSAANGQRPLRHERREERLHLYRAATRANRQLATVLRSQGLSDDADTVAYRAQLLQRTVLRLRGRRAASAFSWLLDLISGYGYEPVRSVIAARKAARGARRRCSGWPRSTRK